MGPSNLAFWREEPGRWPLWLPVFLGAGAALYFALPVEPPVLAGWGALAVGIVAALLAIPGRGRAPQALTAALLLGLGLAKVRESEVATPVLDHSLVAHLTGRIVGIEPRERGLRLVLDEIRSGAFAAGQAPRRIRVSLQVGGDFHPGDWLSLTAQLDMPRAPAEPGAMDFGRRLYFRSIGATGFAYGRARLISPARAPDAWESLAFQVEALRLDMTQRIAAAIPGSSGGIAAALVTGVRAAISEEDDAALRDAGLAHALSISGLHMAMVGGGIFWLVRALLAAFPSIVLRYPIKKWAAALALAASAFYLVISGMEAAAVRAFVMLATVMTAVLLDRPALTMRALALAAAIVLIAKPESITDAGFQMSFAAVAALVAVAEWDQRRQRTAPRSLFIRYLVGIVITSLVAGLATSPFILFHFGRAAHYAVLGNLLAMPVMGLWIMPLAALSVMLMPFGLEGLVLPALGGGIDLMVRMGAFVSSLPGAVSLTSAMPQGALVLIALGGLWAVIWEKGSRWWGVAPIVIGVLLASLTPRPDMLVAPDAQTVAIRGDDGLLHFLRKPKDSFAAREWLRRDGDAREIGDAVGMPGLNCDGVGCVVKRGVTIAAGLRPEALAEDCSRAVVVINASSGTCKGPAVMLDQNAAVKGQGWRVNLSPTPTAQSVRAWRGERPWLATPYQ
jgi:competence protein ComEC